MATIDNCCTCEGNTHALLASKIVNGEHGLVNYDHRYLVRTDTSWYAPSNTTTVAVITFDRFSLDFATVTTNYTGQTTTPYGTIFSWGTGVVLDDTHGYQYYDADQWKNTELSSPYTLSDVSDDCDTLLNSFAPGEVGNFQAGQATYVWAAGGVPVTGEIAHETVWPFPWMDFTGLAQGDVCKAVGAATNPLPTHAGLTWVEAAQCILDNYSVQRMIKMQSWVKTVAGTWTRRTVRQNRVTLDITNTDATFAGGGLILTLPPAFDATDDIWVQLINGIP